MQRRMLRKNPTKGTHGSPVFFVISRMHATDVPPGWTHLWHPVRKCDQARTKCVCLWKNSVTILSWNIWCTRHINVSRKFFFKSAGRGMTLTHTKGFLTWPHVYSAFAIQWVFQLWYVFILRFTHSCVEPLFTLKIIASDVRAVYIKTVVHAFLVGCKGLM